jgi:hypothetical protein
MTKRQVKKHNGNDWQQQAQKQDYDKACNAHQTFHDRKLEQKLKIKLPKNEHIKQKHKKTQAQNQMHEKNMYLAEKSIDF